MLLRITTLGERQIFTPSFVLRRTSREQLSVVPTDGHETQYVDTVQNHSCLFILSVVQLDVNNAKRKSNIRLCFYRIMCINELILKCYAYNCFDTHPVQHYFIRFQRFFFFPLAKRVENE
jgi:hypothetical protein